MICDKIEKAYLYASLSPAFAQAFEILRDGSFIHGEDGLYEIDGKRMFGVIQRYTTRAPENCILEAHRKHIDVQYIVSGEEIIRHAHLDALEIQQAYDETTDRVLLVPIEKMNSVKLGGVCLVSFFPTMPTCPVSRLRAPLSCTRSSSRFVATCN